MYIWLPFPYPAVCALPHSSHATTSTRTHHAQSHIRPSPHVIQHHISTAHHQQASRIIIPNKGRNHNVNSKDSQQGQLQRARAIVGCVVDANRHVGEPERLQPASDACSHDGHIPVKHEQVVDELEVVALVVVLLVVGQLRGRCMGAHSCSVRCHTGVAAARGTGGGGNDGGQELGTDCACTHHQKRYRRSSGWITP